MQALTFALQGNTFAVPIELVKELIELPELTPVPMMPGFLRGVMNLRGSVIPVIDLAQRCGLARTEPGWRSCVVIFELDAGEGRQTLGVMVDAVHEVVEIGADQINEPPQFGTQIAREFLQGMIRLPDRIVLLLEPMQVLSIEQLESLTAVGD
ncbi:chemotaxis protein CheW [Malikia sp.]|uniref:chemotaxis protein CheW n=1 Tax=Malikia sp. TaxID=2070706 RepID=UPI00263671AC|nr:chemotaxis protein CheW [Malikia sp.]MDD2728889.1 chemotaxis protein CheW [Malikia sp.]